jgi:hypothetical protein
VPTRAGLGSKSRQHVFYWIILQGISVELVIELSSVGRTGRRERAVGPPLNPAFPEFSVDPILSSTLVRYADATNED